MLACVSRARHERLTGVVTSQSTDAARRELDLVVRGIPVSIQSSSRSYQRWKDKVSAAARDAVPEAARFELERVTVTIIHYCFDWAEGDLDNIAGGILDGLNGPAYTDDREVTQLVLRRTALDGEQPVDVLDPPPRLAEAIETAYREKEDFVYVRVAPEIDHRRLPWTS